MGNSTGRPTAGLRSHRWRYKYKTSTVSAGGRPVDILNDFYIPVLKRAHRYDRMAGYFRSTSLAVASQGFSALVGRNGHVRMIVGADLAPDDVRAILAGDSDRLTAQLNGQLADPQSWPESVTNGVELLAWMVTHGFLEVRVAFRVHGDLGEPLPYTSLDDGYVHEKWAVFADEQGQRMYVTGSLNESKTALTLNAENIDVHCDWWGEHDRQRVDDAEADFEVLWEDQHPHFRVLSLPEAVRMRLVQIGRQVDQPKEIDGSSAAPREVAPPSTRERLKFALIQDGPRLPNGRYVGIETAPVSPWPHQAVVAKRLVETWPFSYLLCDEVGLGKTIEGGLAIRALHLSGIVRRVLILAPRALTRQWQREMASKFLMSFGRAVTRFGIKHQYEFPYQEASPSHSLYSPDLAIVSTGLAARTERLADLEAAQEFDIVLLDEAHYARRKNPVRGARVNPQYGSLFQAVRDFLAKKTRCLWLATATPMQLDAVEVSDLLQLTDRVGQFQFDPTLMQQYYEILGKLVRNQTLKQTEWEFLRRAVGAVPKQDPLLWQFFQQAVIDGRIRVAVSQWLEHGRTPRGPDLKNMLRLIFAASPLSRTMLRHTRSLLNIYRERGQLGANLATRHILPVPRITFNHQESVAYQELEGYARELVKKIAECSDIENRNTVGFMLSFLRLRFASSLFAIRETLVRRCQRVEATLNHLMGEEAAVQPDFEAWLAAEDDDDDEVVSTVLKNRAPEDLLWERERLLKMLGTLQDVSGPSSKMQVLFSALEKRRVAGTGRIKQTVVFTRFYDTLMDIVNRLRQVDANILLGTYSGQGGQYTDPQTKRLVGVERDEVKHRFLRGEIDVLVCTDAAAEGLNLQTADLLVNYDLPWNPMKVEQRIGRIDRIGQRHEAIFVLNLCYADSAEQIVYDRLLNRLVEAGSIVGTQQISMLPVTLDEFQELAEGKLSEGELEQRAKERIKRFRQRTASMEIPPGDLYEIYTRLTDPASSAPLPVDLNGIWKTLSESRYLRDLGCLVDADRPLFTLMGVDAVVDKSILTVSRDCYETGVTGREGLLHFASYGDPCFDAVLDQVVSFELPSCIQRLTCSPKGVEAELVGYAVATFDTEGVRQVQLITSLAQAADLDIDEAAELTEEEVKPLAAQLCDLARKEFDPVVAVPRLARANRAAGHAQVALNYLLIAARLRSRAQFSDVGDQFWPLMKELEDLMEHREKIIVADIPAEPMRQIARYLLVDATIPQLGTEARLEVPGPLLHSSFDAGHRIADAMKVKKSELGTAAVLARLEREVERELKAIKR